MNEPSSGGLGTAQILRIVIFLGLIVVMIWLLYTIRSTLVPFFIAFVLSYFLMPVVDFLESHRLNRLVAVVVVLLAVFAIVVIPLIVVAPMIVRGTEDMVKSIIGEQGTWYCVVENTGDDVVKIDRFESELEDFKVDGLPLELTPGGRDAESAALQANPKVVGGRDTLRVVFSPQADELRQASLRLYGSSGSREDSIVLTLRGNMEDVPSASDTMASVQFGTSKILISATKHAFGKYKLSSLMALKSVYETSFLPWQKSSQTYLEEILPMLKGRDWIQAANQYLQNVVRILLKETPGLVGQLLSGLTLFIIVPFALFFFLAEGRTIKRAIIEQVPNRYFELILNLLHRIDRQLGSYMRGMVLSVIIVSFLSSTGLYIIGLEHFLVIGLLAGLANVIPYMGPAIGIIAGVVAAVLQYSALSFGVVIPVIIVFAIVQLVDNVFVAPMVVGRSVNLHPLLVIFAVFVGSELFGAVGMLLAVPTTAVIKVSVRTIYEEWRSYSV
ncbi:MAG: AI-2E family transporter [Gemmatimonadetes bacterium]|nr:AI-2E family transporter [Gemmatimonadota bacterium]MYB57295.1 AI-2E family transporter [Gemmatimonadota bacterium]